jgi:mono/diheme cytochrome c family protein
MMKKTYIIFVLSAFVIYLASCGGDPNTSTDTSSNEVQEEVYSEEEEAEDFSKGIGKFKEVTLSPTLDKQLAIAGKEVYEVKCEACHKLSGPRLVGPSWDGVTERRDPAWILNFITNVDEMLAKDPEAMAQFEECLIRMPNQNLSDDDAFAVLEFMRENDGIQ